jgi:hypothetical protein
MDQFKSIKDLNLFEKTVCLKSAAIKNLNISGISIFWKIVIIAVLVWAIVTTAVNIAAYVKILQEPDNVQNLSSSWCIAMLIFNGCLFLVSLTLIIVVGISFKRESDAKKAVQIQETAVMSQGAAMGAAVGAAAAVESTAAAVGAAAGNATATAVMNLTGNQEAAAAAGRQAQAAAVNTALNPSTTQAATQAAVAAATNVASSGNLETAANASVRTVATGGTLGRILTQPSSTAFPSGVPAVDASSFRAMNFPGGPTDSIFNKALSGDFRSQIECKDGSNPPCGFAQDYKVNLNNDLFINPDSRYKIFDFNFNQQ